LNNSNYDHFHGGGDFSHAYVIMHKYFGKKPKIKNEYINFYLQLNMFFCMKFLYTFCQHLGPQILSLVNTKNSTKWKNKIIFLFAFSNEFCTLLLLSKLYYILFNQMHYINISKQICMHYLSMKENWSQFIV